MIATSSNNVVKDLPKCILNHKFNTKRKFNIKLATSSNLIFMSTFLHISRSIVVAHKV